jgi:ubiquinone/menaquinone biosynthesis C-methylase UbiE
MENKMNTPEQNVIGTLKGKKVLFLENDNCLSNGLEEFERILKSAGIEHTVLLELDQRPLEEITKAIDEHDALVFMTQWVYDISKKLFEYVKSLPEKKIVVEGYIHEPTWYYSTQHGTHHDVYIYSCQVYRGEADKDTETFYKLTEQPYWDYENEFDK